MNEIVPWNNLKNNFDILSFKDFKLKIEEMNEQLKYHNPTKAMLDYRGININLSIYSESGLYKISYSLYDINHDDFYAPYFSRLQKGSYGISLDQASFLLNFAVARFYAIQYLGAGIKCGRFIGEKNIYKHWDNEQIHHYKLLHSSLISSNELPHKKAFILGDNTEKSLIGCDRHQEFDQCEIFSEEGQCRFLGESSQLFCISAYNEYIE